MSTFYRANLKSAENNDQRLLRDLQSRKRRADRAFMTVYDSYAGVVRGFVLCFVDNRDHVEDIFQETFISFYKNARAGKDIKNINAYLIGIARNLCMNYHRDRKVTVPIDIGHLTVDERGDLERAEMLEILMQSVSLLDEKYREAFVLRELNGMAYAEIAEITGTSLSGAKTRVARANQQLIKILSPYMKDLER